MSKLYLIHPRNGKEQPATSWSPPPYDLQRQPQRPGELCVEILIPRTLCSVDVRVEAAKTGVPESLWTTLSVEGDRAATSVAEALGLSADRITALLDEAADCHLPGAHEGTPGTRLAAYASALTAARARDATAAIGPVLLRPSTTMLAAWTIAASRLNKTTEDWSRDSLEQRCGAVVAWETAAAFCGQTLAEWAALQAARRWRSRRTAPQTAA